jgi:hypothetical protein
VTPKLVAHPHNPGVVLVRPDLGIATLGFVEGPDGVDDLTAGDSFVRPRLF